jgi:hypothetical protein
MALAGTATVIKFLHRQFALLMPARALSFHRKLVTVQSLAMPTPPLKASQEVECAVTFYPSPPGGRAKIGTLRAWEKRERFVVERGRTARRSWRSSSGATSRQADFRSSAAWD